MANATSTELQELYVAYFGRAADPTGLDYWTEKGITTAAFAANMYAQNEFTSVYGSLSTEAQVNQIYKNLFDREADATGLSYWTQQIKLGNLELASIANDLIYAANNNSGSASDKTALSNKSAAAVAYTAKVKETTAAILAYQPTTSDPWVAGANITEGVTYLSGINGTTAHTAAGITTSVNTVTTNGSPGTNKTFTLTTKADDFTGGAGADVFTAVDTTFALLDKIDGGAGTDRLNYTDSSNAGGIPLTAASNIETFYIRNIETTNGGETYDFGLIASETEIWHDRATDASTWTNINTGTKVGMKGDGSTVLGEMLFQYTTATDAVDLAIDGGVGAVGTAPAISENGTNGTATSVTISSTGAANTVGTVDLANATITTATVTATTNLKGDFFSQATNQVGTNGAITISGDATLVELTAALDNTIKTIDASGLTSGGVKATLGTLATQSFTGGAGADTITTGAAPTSGTIAAGAGSDLLILGANTHMDTALEAAKFTGFETVQTAAAATTGFDMGLMTSLTGLKVAATGANANTYTNLSAAQAANIDIIGAINAAGVSFSLVSDTGTSDVLSIDIGNDTVKTGTAIDADSLTFNGFETLNVNAVHGSGTVTAGGNRTSTIATLTSDKATAVNMTGTAFSVENAALTKAATYDATALTGDGGATTNKGLTLLGALIATSTVKGSDYVDTVTIGGTGSTYTLGAGKDAITSTQANLSGSVSVDGGAGTDTITISDAATATTATFTVTDNSFANVTNTEVLSISAAHVGNIVWNLGGYANAMATAAGGTLKVTATAFAQGATADTVTINASGLSGSNALDLTFTNTVVATTANAGNDVFTGGAGADKFTITYDAADTDDNSDITVNAGAGNDTITLVVSAASTTATGTLKLNGQGGDDTIVGSANIDTITGGLGTDTMTGGTGADIFIVSTATHSNAATAGAIDKITDFAGTSDDLKTGVAGTELNKETLTIGYSSADTIAELNDLLNSNNGTATTAKFDGTGADCGMLTLNDGRILVAQDLDASGTFTAADIVVEITGTTGTIAVGDIIA